MTEDNIPPDNTLSTFELQELIAEIKVGKGEVDEAQVAVALAQDDLNGKEEAFRGNVNKLLEHAIA